MICCYLLVLLIAGSSGQLDELLIPTGIYESAAYQWVGHSVTSGCGATEMLAEVEVACTLPAGRVTATADRGGEGVKVTCEDATYTCEDIKEAKPYITNYTHIHTHNRTVQYLTVESCQPAEPLSCLLDLIGGSDVKRVTFKYLNTSVTERHLTGLESVTSLIIMYAGSNITSIPFDALSTLPALEYFKLTGGNLRLTNITGKALKALRKFELAEGSIEVLPKEVFLKTPNLVKLSLWGNHVKEIEGDAFDGLPLLQNVSLNSNRLAAIPPTLFVNTPLVRYIDLYNNELRVLRTDTFRGLTELREVLLFGNIEPLRVESLVFANLPSLINVDLNQNDIDTLPADTFANSTNIRKINLNGNKLVTLPEPLFSNIDLKELNLSENLIEMLPVNLFRDQSNMTVLDCSHNRMTVLPVGLFASLKKLSVLKVTHNQIGYLDGGVFAGLSGLKKLYLDNNKLHTLETRTFDLVNNLQVLSLSHNSLSFPLPPTLGYSDVGHPSPFASVSQLVELVLHHNNISRVCDDWRYVMVYLKKLDLSYNRITELSDTDLEFIGPATVDLRFNNITTVRPGDVLNDESVNLSLNILLDNNPFNCDCGLYPLIRFMKSKPKYNRMELEHAQCATPPDLSGNKLTDLSPDVLTCDYTTCPENCKCLVRPLSLRFELYCNQLPDKLPDELPYGLSEAVLSLKNISDLSSLPRYVKSVNLTNLNLTDPPNVASSLTVDLRNNRLTTAPIDLLRQNCSLFLSGNPFNCDCDEITSLQMLNEHKYSILDFDEVTCANGDNMSTLNINPICDLRYSVIAVSILVVASLLSMTFIIIYYKNRVFIRIVLRKLGFTIADVLPEGIQYDAFISFAHQDEAVVTERILPNLEGRKKLKLCIHTRDWIAGEWISEQIARSVDQSRCTIIVLSKHFVESVWGSMEFRTAHGRGRIIILLIDDVYLKQTLDSDLKAYLTLNTYIKLEDPLVWERLTDAVLVHGPENRKTLEDVKSDKMAPVLLNVQLNDAGKLVNTAPSRF